MKLLRALCAFALIAGSTALPALAGDRGHGAIFYSTSQHRYSWAKSQTDDATAARIAQALCAGGTQYSSEIIAAYRGGDANADATGDGADIRQPASDCVKVIKFDSESNHQCGGFGYVYNGRISDGKRERTRAEVRNDLSDWDKTVIVCNDETATTGLERFGQALQNLANALSGHNNTNSDGNNVNDDGGPKNSNDGNSPLTSTSIGLRNDTHATVTYFVACPNDSKWQAARTIAPGDERFVDSSDFGNCSKIMVDISSVAADGGKVDQKHELAGGHTYRIVTMSGGNYPDIDTAALNNTASGDLRIDNDLPLKANLTFTCPNLTPTKKTVAANDSLPQHLNCSSGATVTVEVFGNGGMSQTRTFNVENGVEYHLRFDQNTQLLRLQP